MRLPRSILVTGAAICLVGGCTNYDPHVLAACLNKDVVNKFEIYQPSNKILVGGVTPQGKVNCYWSPRHVLLGYSAAFTRCSQDGNIGCTYIANQDRVFLSHYERPWKSPPPTARSSGHSEIAWDAIFNVLFMGLAGAADGYVQGVNRRGTLIQPDFESRSRPSTVQPSLCPNGQYVMGRCSITPDGTFVGGNPTLAPNGSYVGGKPSLAPDGSWVGENSGRTTLCPDGSWVGGTTCVLAPDGRYLGR